MEVYSAINTLSEVVNSLKSQVTWMYRIIKRESFICSNETAMMYLCRKQLNSDLAVLLMNEYNITNDQITEAKSYYNGNNFYYHAKQMTNDFDFLALLHLLRINGEGNLILQQRNQLNEHYSSLINSVLSIECITNNLTTLRNETLDSINQIKPHENSTHPKEFKHEPHYQPSFKFPGLSDSFNSDNENSFTEYYNEQPTQLEEEFSHKFIQNVQKPFIYQPPAKVQYGFPQTINNEGIEEQDNETVPIHSKIIEKQPKKTTKTTKQKGTNVKKLNKLPTATYELLQTITGCSGCEVKSVIAKDNEFIEFYNEMRQCNQFVLLFYFQNGNVIGSYHSASPSELGGSIKDKNHYIFDVKSGKKYDWKLIDDDVLQIKSKQIILTKVGTFIPYGRGIIPNCSLKKCYSEMKDEVAIVHGKVGYCKELFKQITLVDIH
ncbi:hypothetical protein QTN25_000144 [Entamoeba marina]